MISYLYIFDLSDYAKASPDKFGVYYHMASPLYICGKTFI